jgi:DNA repair protein RadA/Sms
MQYRCSQCGYQSVKWLGRCPNCGKWDTFVANEDERASDSSWIGEEVLPISQIDLKKVKRLECGMSEVDRLLGGGLVPGGVILFGGEPGIGKSTLLLQIAKGFAQNHGDVLYVSGEESAAQIKLRATRLEVSSDHIYVLSEQRLHRIAAAVKKIDPILLIIDSIQTTLSDSVPGESGSVRQMRETSAELTRLTKGRNMATFLIGHITKEGAFAGPKTVEHLVDVAIYLEGNRGEDVRILRSVKNRFGGTDEVVVFQMQAGGLKTIADPSRFFLADHQENPGPGTVIVPILEGTRPIMVELQALVSPTGGYGVPQRRCSGLDYNRILLLLAVVERQLGVNTSGADVYLSLAGGLETRERGTDLGVTAAIVSSLRNKPIPGQSAIVGEVGLTGEVRGVKRLRERINEAGKLGYKRILVPGKAVSRTRTKIEVIAVETIGQAINVLGLS